MSLLDIMRLVVKHRWVNLVMSYSDPSDRIFRSENKGEFDFTTICYVKAILLPNASRDLYTVYASPENHGTYVRQTPVEGKQDMTM